MSQDRTPLPEVLWFRFPSSRPHAFFLLRRGALDEASACGLAEIDDAADEPERGNVEALPHRCVYCLTVLGDAVKLRLNRTARAVPTRDTKDDANN